MKQHSGLVKWKEGSTSDFAELTEWAERYPNDVYFCVDLRGSGLSVLDVDVKPRGDGSTRNGVEVLDKIASSHGGVPTTFMGKTPSGGLHYFFTGTLRQTSSKIGPGLDTVYMVPVPGSEVPGKGKYEISKRGWGLAAVPVPGWLRQMVVDATGGGRGQDGGGCGTAAGEVEAASADVATASGYLLREKPAVEGDGGDTHTIKVACKLRDLGIPRDTSVGLMAALWNPRCVPPWDMDELAMKVENAYTYASGVAGGSSVAAMFDDLGDAPEEEEEEEKGKGVDGEELGGKEKKGKKGGNGVEGTGAIAEMSRKYGVVMVGSRCVVVEPGRTPPEGGMAIYNLNAFHAWMANRKTLVPNANGDPVAKPLSQVWMESPKRRSFPGGLYFAPPGAPEVEGGLNMWKGFGVVPAPVEDRDAWKNWRKHVQEVICGGDRQAYEYLMDWLADFVQRPGAGKPGVAVVLCGGEGVGKGAFVEPFLQIAGQHGVQVGSKEKMTGQFNSHMADVVLAFFNEAFWAGDKAAESKLKNMITERRTILEKKGVDAIKLDSFTRFIMDSNEDWVVPASADARRYFVLEARNAQAKSATYFAPIWKEVGAPSGGIGLATPHILRHLLDRDISNSDIRDVPQTAALAEQKTYSMGSVAAYLHSVLEAGEWLEAEPGLGEEDGDSGGDVWPSVLVPTPAYAAYQKASKTAGVRPVSQFVFMKQVATFLGVDRNKRYHSRKDPFTGRRGKGYLMPSLAECRDRFSSQFGVSFAWQDSLESADGPP